jgi:hypothetical protein
MDQKEHAELVMTALEEAFKDEPRVKAIELTMIDGEYAVRVIVDSTADMEATQFIVDGVVVVFEEAATVQG